MWVTKKASFLEVKQFLMERLGNEAAEGINGKHGISLTLPVKKNLVILCLFPRHPSFLITYISLAKSDHGDCRFLWLKVQDARLYWKLFIRLALWLMCRRDK